MLSTKKPDQSGQTIKYCQPVVSFAKSNVSHAHFVKGQPQKKGISPATVKQNQQLNFVNNVSCVDQLCSVKLAPNVPLVVQNLPVGARLSQFWKTWETLWAVLKVVQMLKEGYILPFKPYLILPGHGQSSATMYILTGTSAWQRHCIS